MKSHNLKGSGGFGISWLILLIYSVIISIWDLKLAVMGIIICGAFGFLGFDMVRDIVKMKYRKERRNKNE